jgi:hypothetical protein|tara:strand:- start:6512 stop:6940 length:429 start_codon:yes stop_codon:yes gene_type:complete
VELSTWNVQEYELTDSDGEKAVILFRPLTQGWRTRHLEITLGLQRAAEKVAELQEGVSEAPPSKEDFAALIAAQTNADEVLSQFRGELFRDLIVGSKNLTIDGEVPSRDDLILAVIGIETLGQGLAQHIISEGHVSESEGKD